MFSAIVWAQERPPRDLPLDPIVFGVVTFVIMLVLMIGVLIFGKGRPHA